MFRPTLSHAISTLFFDGDNSRPPRPPHFSRFPVHPSEQSLTIVILPIGETTP